MSDSKTKKQLHEATTYTNSREDILQLVYQRDQAGIIDVYPGVDRVSPKHSELAWAGVAHEKPVVGLVIAGDVGREMLESRKRKNPN